VEGRAPGKINLEEETSNGTGRVTNYDGNEIGKNKVVIGAESKEGVSEFDAFFQ